MADEAGNGMSQPLLDIRGLKTHFATDDGMVRAVDGVDIAIGRGETVGIVGESGCGKTVTAMSVLKLAAGGAYEEKAPSETAWLLMDGEVNIVVGNQGHAMSRRSLFDESPSALHVAAGESVRIEAAGAELGGLGRRIQPSDIASRRHLREHARVRLDGRHPVPRPDEDERPVATARSDVEDRSAASNRVQHRPKLCPRQRVRGPSHDPAIRQACGRRRCDLDRRHKYEASKRHTRVWQNELLVVHDPYSGAKRARSSRSRARA